MNTVDKFVQLIEEICSRSYNGRNGHLVRGSEKDLQVSIVKYARSLGYRAINEDIFKIMVQEQPLIDVLVEIDGFLHAVKLKIMNIEEFQFYNGLDQVLSYSMYGVDYLCLIHYLTASPTLDFLRMINARLNAYKKCLLIESILQKLEIRQVGYLLLESLRIMYKIKPIEPLKFDEQNKEKRKEIRHILEIIGSKFSVNYH